MRPRYFADSMNVKTAFMLTTVAAFLFSMFIHNFVQGAECTLATRLLDPYIRADYEAIVESGRIPDNGELCGSSLPASTGENRILDPISMECINCHDGALASAVDFRFEKTESQGATNLITLTASHPIGIDYTKYSCNNAYSYWGRLPAGMVLMNGQIGCASCHNLLGTNRLYLAVEMTNSELCFSCHRK